MKIGLVICPWFSGGSSVPLGLSYINGTLKDVDQETYPLDIEFELNKIDPRINQIINSLFGYPAHEINKVMFIIQFELLLCALYPEAYKFGSSIGSIQKMLFIEDLKKKIAKIIGKYINNYKIEMFLFSVYSSNLAISLITAQIIKRKTSRPVIFGGPGVGISEIYRFLLKTGFVDGIVVGEGEETIVDIIKTQDFLNSSSSIHGYVTNSSLDRYVPRHLITDIDSIPYPVFADFPAKGYNLRAYLLSGKTTFIPISTSRGCVMKCSFCSENKYWQKFRLRSVESITDEILYQTKKYKINNIRFNDSLTNPKRVWLEQLVDSILDKNIKINWVFTYMRPEDIDIPLAQKLKKSGCHYICLGVESGSIEVRKRMKKSTNNKEIISVLTALSKSEIIATVTIIDGFPSESLEEFMDNIRLFEEWKVLVNGFNDTTNWLPGGRMRLEPYSDIYLRPRSYGVKISTYPIKIPNELENLREEISRLSLIWNDSISQNEKNIRDVILRYYYFSHQPNLLSNVEIYQNINPELIQPKTIFKSISYPFLSFINKNKNSYFLVKENNILEELDNLSHYVYKILEKSSLNIDDICKKIRSENNSPILRAKVVDALTHMINLLPYPLIRLLISEDMKTDKHRIK